MIDVLLPLAKF